MTRRYMGRPIPARETSKAAYVKKHFPENYDAWKRNQARKGYPVTDPPEEKRASDGSKYYQD